MIIFLHTISAILTIVRSIDATAEQRVLVFDDFKEGTKLVSAGLRTIVGNSKLFCAISCAFGKQCKSFHYCTNKSCKINSIDADSDDFDIKVDAQCHYMGLKVPRESSFLDRGRCKSGEFEFPSRHGFNCLVHGDAMVKYEFSRGVRIWQKSGTLCNEAGKVLLYSLDWTEAGLGNVIVAGCRL